MASVDERHTKPRLPGRRREGRVSRLLYGVCRLGSGRPYLRDSALIRKDWRENSPSKKPTCALERIHSGLIPDNVLGALPAPQANLSVRNLGNSKPRSGR